MDRPHHLSPKKETVRISFAYRNFAAKAGISHIGLGVSQMHTATTLRRNGYWTKVVPIVSPEDIRKELLGTVYHEIPYSHVVMAAPWIEIQDLQKLAYDWHDTNFVVICHSNCAFLSADTGAVKRLRELAGLQLHAPNFHLAGNSTRFSHWADYAYGHKILRLPNLYDCATLKTPSPHARLRDHLRIGCFGAMRPLKNMFTAACATMEIAERLGADVEFHVTTGRDNSRRRSSLSPNSLPTIIASS